MRFFPALLLLSTALFAQPKSPARFDISWQKPLDGRLLLILSTASNPEPRMAVNEGLATQQIFGVDVDSARSGIIDGSTLGYPRESFARVPAGDYYVQAVLNIYETFHRADGRTLKLPMDQGEGQHWNHKPGNLYSEPAKIHFDPRLGAPLFASSLPKLSPRSTLPPTRNLSNTSAFRASSSPPSGAVRCS